MCNTCTCRVLDGIHKHKFRIHKYLFKPMHDSSAMPCSPDIIKGSWRAHIYTSNQIRVREFTISINVLSLLLWRKMLWSCWSQSVNCEMLFETGQLLNGLELWQGKISVDNVHILFEGIMICNQLKIVNCYQLKSIYTTCNGVHYFPWLYLSSTDNPFTAIRHVYKGNAGGRIYCPPRPPTHPQSTPASRTYIQPPS